MHSIRGQKSRRHALTIEEKTVDCTFERHIAASLAFLQTGQEILTICFVEIDRKDGGIVGSSGGRMIPFFAGGSMLVG